jgi:hypothetical protein
MDDHGRTEIVEWDVEHHLRLPRLVERRFMDYSEQESSASIASVERDIPKIVITYQSNGTRVDIVWYMERVHHDTAGYGA